MRELIRHLPGKHRCFWRANDNFARRVCLLALEAGRSVPEEIAILGVDAEEMISLTSPVSLSSIDPNAYRIGYEAARTVARLLENPATVAPGDPHSAQGGGRRGLHRPLGDERPCDRQGPSSSSALHACQDLTVEALCTHLGISRRSLERRFRKALNKSLNDQITKVRIDRASAFSRKSPTCRSGEIADKCGLCLHLLLFEGFQERHRAEPTCFQRDRLRGRMKEIAKGSSSQSRGY